MAGLVAPLQHRTVRPRPATQASARARVQPCMRAMLGLGSVLVFGCGGARVAPSAPPAPVASAASDPPGVCSLKLAEPAVRDNAASRLPPELYARALAPVVTALCACTRDEDRTRIQVRVLPERGEVRATAPEEPRIDACLADQLGPGRFARFDVPPGAACADCSPVHLAPSRPDAVEHFRAATHPKGAKAHGASATAPPATLVFALSLDRRRNDLRDASGPHLPDVDDR